MNFFPISLLRQNILLFTRDGQIVAAGYMQPMKIRFLFLKFNLSLYGIYKAVFPKHLSQIAFFRKFKKAIAP